MNNKFTTIIMAIAIAGNLVYWIVSDAWFNLAVGIFVVVVFLQKLVDRIVQRLEAIEKEVNLTNRFTEMGVTKR